MGREKRPWGIVAGPVVFVLGLGAFWGAKSALAVKDQVQDWGYQFEHSSAPLHMEMPDIPLVPPLYVNGDRIGRIETIVVQRTRPSSIDSLTIIATVDSHFMGELSDCALRLRLRDLDEHTLTEALHCTRDTDNLQAFGHLEVEGSDHAVPILVREGDLPCDERGIQVGPCGAISGAKQAELQAELRDLERELEQQNQEITIQLKQSSGEVRVELERAREELRRARQEVRAKVRTVIR